MKLEMLLVVANKDGKRNIARKERLLITNITKGSVKKVENEEQVTTTSSRRRQSIVTEEDKMGTGSSKIVVEVPVGESKETIEGFMDLWSCRFYLN